MSSFQCIHTNNLLLPANESDLLAPAFFFIVAFCYGLLVYPWYWQLVAATEGVVHILPECIIVVCVYLGSITAQFVWR